MNPPSFHYPPWKSYTQLRESFVSHRIAHLGLVRLRLRLGKLLLLQLLGLSQLLPRENSLVLEDDLLTISRHLVAFLWSGPEVIDGEAIVEVGAEVVHGANGEHDIHAELQGRRFSFRQVVEIG